eukprot:352444-Chlamydomonas_euryale.AAC.3
MRARRFCRCAQTLRLRARTEPRRLVSSAKPTAGCRRRWQTWARAWLWRPQRRTARGSRCTRACATGRPADVHACTAPRLHAHALPADRLHAHAPLDAPPHAHVPLDAPLIAHALLDAPLCAHAPSNARLPRLAVCLAAYARTWAQ